MHFQTRRRALRSWTGERGGVAMASVMPFDELNKLTIQIRERFGGQPLPTENNQQIKEDVLDMLLDFFLLSYAMGNTVTNENLNGDWIPTAEDALETVNKKVADKTWTERVEEYFSKGGTEDDLIRIAETEMHRDANESALKTAQKFGATRKTWATMLDDRVRETHDYLEGETVGIDDDFYTYDGDHASAPGLFELAENNVNCRCELIFS